MLNNYIVKPPMYNIFFHNVGQGLFVSGEIRLQRKIFNWVYDCGTSSVVKKQPQFEQCFHDNLDNYIKNNKSVDMIVISHFDEDHISGLHELLSRCNVKNIIFPYLTQYQKLKLIAKKRNININYIKYVLEPEKYIEEINKKGNTKVIFSIPKKGEIEEIEEIHNDEIVYKKIRIKDNTSNKLDEVYIIENIDLINFEFIFYHNEKYLPKINNSFIKKTNKIMVLLEESIKRNRHIKIIINILVNLFDTTFGKSPKHRNDISLFLYGGFKKEITCKFKGCFLYYRDFHKKNGFLLTGDGKINKNNIKKIRLCFSDRLENIFIFQVMHHGSSYNCGKRIYNYIKPIYSIFSYGLQNNYNHPSQKVLNYLINSNCIHVNEENYKKFKIKKCNYSCLCSLIITNEL